MDVEKLKQLFKENKLEEAREALEEFLESSISPREQGDALISLTSMYMEVENTLNLEYIKILKEAVSQLGSLKKRENKLADAISLQNARRTISES